MSPLPILLAWASMVAQQAPPKADEPRPSPKAEADASEASALADYRKMTLDKPPVTANDHWKLAAWCEKNGLRAESYVHYGKIVELDPKRDAAWQKLGFKKVDGRWMTPRQVAEEAEQKKADKTWAAALKKAHRDIHGGKKQAEAQDALDKITDPAAVPAIYREFCGGASTDQQIGLQVLGQIEGPVASQVIAVMALYGKNPAVRRHATELLRNRPAEEYLEMLVALMKDLYKYEVRPVGGPGSPGVLFVEGEQFNVRRFYAPPPPPSYIPRPGDLVTYDANGLPVVSHTTTNTVTLGPLVGVPGSKTLATQREAVTYNTETFSFSAAYIEAQRAALNAQAQLQSDIARIDELNEGRRQFNELVMNVAKGATGKDPGRTAKEWRDMLAKSRDERYARRPVPRKPTLNEMVPLDYVPNLAATVSFQSQTKFITQTVVDT